MQTSAPSLKAVCRCGYFATRLGLTRWEAAIWDEGSGGLKYPALLAGIQGGLELSQGEHVRTLYGKSTSRHLFRAL
jgi:hypothetical protein